MAINWERLIKSDGTVNVDEWEDEEIEAYLVQPDGKPRTLPVWKIMRQEADRRKLKVKVEKDEFLFK
ncbi:MAG: hypothetical protein JWN37_636 [Candidatus Nomurabacteria bacterium]|nr:hypothetical protein [Candidatus Nomurabacteria bacterium]